MKTIKIFLVFVLFLFLIMGQVQAAGLVPCGLSVDDPNTPRNETLSCGFCDFFVLLSNILDFVMRMAMVVATLMLVIGGCYFFFAGGNPGNLETGKKIMTSTLWGLVIIFGAFLIVGTVLNALDLNVWTKDIYKEWMKGNFFQIPGC